MSAASQEVITAGEVAAAQKQRTSLVEKFSHRYGLEPNKMMGTLKATAFRQREGEEITNEQMAALLIVADQHGLNPWTKEIYAFPSRQGIVPVVGVDGWAHIINGHPQFDGMDFEQDDTKCSCTIHRKDRSHPITVTEYHAECVRPTDPWKTHPKRMLRHKAMIQCARIAFAFAGIYDPDEAERVLAAEDAIDVTPEQSAQPGKRMGAKRLREYVERVEAAVKADDGPGLLEVLDELTPDEYLQVWDKIRSWDRAAFKKLEEKAKAASCGVNLDKWAVELFGSCKDETALTAAWVAVQSAYDANGVEVPPDVETCYLDRKSELVE